MLLKKKCSTIFGIIGFGKNKFVSQHTAIFKLPPVYSVRRCHNMATVILRKISTTNQI